MRDLGREIASAAAELAPRWDEARREEALRGVHRRRRRARVMRGVLALLALGTGVKLWTRAPAPPPLVAAPVATPRPTELDLAGARAWPVEGAQLRSTAEATAELVRGAARFVVEDTGTARRFVAGPVVVKVQAARFALAFEAGRVLVTVEEGSVLVFAGGHSAELKAGESDRFPRAIVEATPSEPRPPVAAPPKIPAAPQAPGWRELAAEGDYEAAHAALSRVPAPIEDVAQLLLAADVARLSHHPAEAEAPLNAILRDHGDDPRAALAAFTLGRVRLDELGRPREAAQAFERAQALQPDGPLVEDAIAREVEAWSRAGETGRARARAEDYLRRYPDGRRARAVRKLGGLD